VEILAGRTKGNYSIRIPFRQAKGGAMRTFLQFGLQFSSNGYGMMDVGEGGGRAAEVFHSVPEGTFLCTFLYVFWLDNSVSAIRTMCYEKTKKGTAGGQTFKRSLRAPIK
jgi:hypothetical protein